MVVNSALFFHLCWYLIAKPCRELDCLNIIRPVYFYFSILPPPRKNSCNNGKKFFNRYVLLMQKLWPRMRDSFVVIRGSETHSRKNLCIVRATHWKLQTLVWYLYHSNVARNCATTICLLWPPYCNKYGDAFDWLWYWGELNAEEITYLVWQLLPQKTIFL